MNLHAIARLGTGLVLLAALMLSTLLIYAHKQPVSSKTRLQFNVISLHRPVSASEAAEIKAAVLEMDGIHQVSLNNSEGVITYIYDPFKLHSDNIYNKLLAAKKISGI